MIPPQCRSRRSASCLPSRTKGAERRGSGRRLSPEHPGRSRIKDHARDGRDDGQRRPGLSQGARRRAADISGQSHHDMLTRLVQGEQNGEPLSKIELARNSIVILHAGRAATTNLVGNGLYNMPERPDKKARLLAEPELIGLRRNGPALRSSRAVRPTPRHRTGQARTCRHAGWHGRGAGSRRGQWRSRNLPRSRPVRCRPRAEPSGLLSPARPRRHSADPPARHLQASPVANAIRANAITSRFPSVHAAPVHIGIRDPTMPDCGDTVERGGDELPVFWACGVTPPAAIAPAKPQFAITPDRCPCPRPTTSRPRTRLVER